MKGQKSLRYLLVTAMLVVSIPIVAVGQLHEVLIDVSGMTWAFCALGLETSLKRLVGVKEIRVDVLEERVEILGGEFELDVPRLVKIVRDGGFTPRSLKIKATGTVERTKRGYTFVVGQTNLRFPLIQDDVLKHLLDQSRYSETQFSILGSVVIPPPKGEVVPEAPVGSLTIERFVFVMTGM